MKEKIATDLKNAMKNQNRDLLSVVRMLKGAIQLEEIRLKRELSDEEVINVVVKQIKMRKEAIVDFEKGGRSDLVNQNNKEIELLNRYMPKQLIDEEVMNIIEEAFNEINPSQASDIGKIMNIVSPKLKGRTDMGKVSKIIKNKLKID